MGPFSKFRGAKPNSEATAQAQEEAPEFERVTWYRDAGLKVLYWHCFILCVGSASTGYDGMFFNSVQNFDSWQDYFGRPASHILGLLAALYQIGSIGSIPIVPYVADNYGRRLPIVIGGVITIAGALLQGCCQNMGGFMGGRVLLGFGNSFSQMASPMLLTEIAHPQHRARLTTVYNCLWNVGAIIVAWTAFGTNFLDNEWSWRVPAILQALPSVVQIVGVWWIPESPRYLIANDRLDEALLILAKYHANGDADHPTVKFEYREIRDTIKMEQAAKAHSTYLDFFRSSGNRYRFMVLISLGIFSQWSGNAIISNYTAILYENAGITSSIARLGMSAGSSMVSLVVSITFALLVDKFGRRPIFLTSTGGMFGTFVFWTLTCALYEEYQAPGANHAMIFFIWVFNVAYAIAWSGLLIGYAVEILPYVLRAKGLMILNIAIQVALTLNNYANPVALKHFENETWKLYLIYTCWIGFELAFVYFKYVETKGPTLEELAKVIDGPGANVASLNMDQMEKEARIVNGRDSDVGQRGSEQTDGVETVSQSVDNKAVPRD
ncbi:Lactose permease 7 [Colletotrichum chlorophyti]|uniref:Lactose permease 7 n=1 Tax=Colletotrichum chlorophyti TaxID=708187 RepID=A0A1Q8S5Z4_9PEZI|nr:Lactose permease 7 [Colletotrichum chlorophyti]